MGRRALRVTDVDASRLRQVFEGASAGAPREEASVESLEWHLSDAEVLPAARIDPDVVTLGSQVRVTDRDTRRSSVVQVVLPAAADAGAGRISVLAPLGRALLGRKVGDRVTCQAPGGLHRLQVDAIPYQPEREGLDLV